MKSVLTSLQIFELVATKQPIGVTEIARALNIGKTTAHRSLQVLHKAGWIRMKKDSPQTRWVITTRALMLGRNVEGYWDLREATLQIMNQLWAETRESVNLVVAEGRKAVVIERLESPQPLRLFAPLGSSAPMHLVASGKVFLAYSDEKELEQYLLTDLEKTTAKSIQDPAALIKELAQIRTNGYAFSIDELSTGASAVAVPIANKKGTVIAALTIFGPSTRFPVKIRKRYAAMMKKAVAGLQFSGSDYKKDLSTDMVSGLPPRNRP